MQLTVPDPSFFSAYVISINIMEVIPSKFRSPPPKPPRRRHSEQLSISSTGTYPSRKKYVEENNQYIKGAQINVDVTRCGSLPSNWTNDYSFDQIAENAMLVGSVHPGSMHTKSIPERLTKNTSASFDVPLHLYVDKYSNGLIPRTENRWWTKNQAHSEKTKMNDLCISKSPVKLLEHLDTDNKIVSKLVKQSTSTDKADLNLLPKEYHRRHHSDPVLSFLDSTNATDALQKFTVRSHSFFEKNSFERQNRLGNSTNSSFTLKESQYLLEEMKYLKEINNKLWQQLCSTQAYIEKLEENSDESVPAFSIADLLSSIYCSQQAKDSAMEDRMKVVLEQRDTAVQELEDIVQIIARSFEDDVIQEEEKSSEKEIVDVLKEIDGTYNPAKLLQQQRLLLAYLYRAKELKQDRIVHELKLAITERNHLLEKVKYLEHEMKNVKVCNQIWNSDNKQWENDLLNILCQVIHQRDVVLKNNVTYNFEHINHRSASECSVTIAPVTKDYEFLQENSDVNNCGIKANFKPSKSNQSSTEPLNEIRVLKSEIMVLSKALEIEVEKREIAEENCLRLERLVNVLQKKVNGKNVGVSV